MVNEAAGDAMPVHIRHQVCQSVWRSGVSLVVPPKLAVSVEESDISESTLGREGEALSPKTFPPYHQRTIFHRIHQCAVSRGASQVVESVSRSEGVVQGSMPML